MYAPSAAAARSLVATARTGSVAASSSSSLLSTSSIDNFLRPALLRPSTSPVLQFVRTATHKSEGRANGPKAGPGKRLGAKKGSEEYVIPGNIIFRQRGTEWHPGENCALGRDHCIYATEPGYVKFYRDPHRHPKRRYIGVTFNRDDVLPTPPHAARRRRLGLVAVHMKPEGAAADAGHSSTLPAAQNTVLDGGREGLLERKSQLRRAFHRARKGYVVRQPNWEIGRAAEKAGVVVTRTKKNDRMALWRLKSEKRKETAMMAAARQVKSKKGKGRRR